MDATVERLVAFVRNFRLENLGATALAETKVRLIDTIGCALGAYLAPPVAIARRLTPVVAEGRRARVFGTMVHTTPDYAAFINGAMARYLDFNDSFHTVGGGHPSDNIPAMIAIGEAFELDGRALLGGIAVAYEVHTAFGDAIDTADLGFDQATTGVIAAALGAGWMLGLDDERLRQAIALAIIPNLPLMQTRVGELSMWKNVCTALGARQGIFAALLAREGMTGPVDPIEGARGLWKTIGAENVVLSRLDPPGPKQAAVTESFLKRWAAADSCQVPIDTARELYPQLAGREIAEVAVRVYRKSSQETAVSDRARWLPKTRESADHSMPIVVAMTLLDGAIYPDRHLATRHERFGDPDVVGLVEKMKVEYDPEFSKDAPEIRSCRIEVRFTDGTSAHVLRRQPAAELTRMTPEELHEKFEALTCDTLRKVDRTAFLGVVDRLESEPVARLVDTLAV